MAIMSNEFFRAYRLRNRVAILGLAIVLVLPGFVGAPASAAFVPSSWTDPAPIYAGSGMARNNPLAQIGEDAQGNRIAVWYDFNKVVGLFAAYAPANGSWTAPIPIDYQFHSNLLGFDLAVAPNGDAAVAWLAFYDLSPLVPYDAFAVEAATYSHGGGWGYPETVSLIDSGLGHNPTRAGVPSVDMSDDGRAWIVWTENADYMGTNETNVYAAYHEGTWVNWTAPEIIDSEPGDPGAVDVAAMGSGQAAAAWIQDDGTNLSLYTAQYSDSAWKSAAELAVDPEPVAKIDIEASAPGEAVLVWTQGPSGGRAVYSSNLAGGTWSAIAKIDSQASEHWQLAVDANAGGAAVAVWVPNDGTYTMRSAAYDPTAGWAGAAQIENSSGFISFAGPGVDAQGNALILWMGTVNIYFPTVMAKEFHNGSGWQPSTKVVGDHDIPEDLAVAPDGHATAAIRHFDGTIPRPYEIRFMPDDLTAPRLSVTEPFTGTNVSGPAVTVRGTTEPGASVWVSGTPAYVDATGNFSLVLSIGDGTWSIHIVARDRAGNEADLVLYVTYNDPIPALLAQIAALQTQINGSGSSGGGINSSLWQQLNDTEDQVAALQSDLTTLRAQLNTTSSDADEAQAVAQRAETTAAGATMAMVAGLAGAALGAAALAMSMRRPPGGEKGLPVKEKGNRTRPTSNLGVAPPEETGGAPSGDPGQADDLPVKEKGNRTK